MRVVITGALGFVGRNLAQFLAARGVEVWGVEVAPPYGGANYRSHYRNQGTGCDDVDKRGAASCAAAGALSQPPSGCDERVKAGCGGDGAPPSREATGARLDEHSLPSCGGAEAPALLPPEGGTPARDAAVRACRPPEASQFAAYSSRLTIESDGASPSRGGGDGYSRMYGWEELAEVPWGEVDGVVHLAGKAHDTRKVSSEASYFEVNVGLTERLLAALVPPTSDYRNHYRNQGSGCDDVDKKEGGRGDGGEGHVGVNADDADVRQFSPASAGPLIAENCRTGVGNTGCGGDGAVSSRGWGGKIIFFSSVKAVADEVAGVLDEAAVPQPKTAYGRSKLAAEGLLLQPPSGCNERVKAGCGGDSAPPSREASKRRLGAASPSMGAAGRGIYILRPVMIHGPGNRGNLNLLWRVVRWGIPWPLGAFENRRSFASIGNVCEVVLALLEGEVASGVYQVADDEALSTNELIALMAEVLGRKPRIWRIPCGLMSGVARLGDWLRLPLNSERLKKLTESYVASNAKLKRALGWERMPIRAGEGMQKTLIALSSGEQR